jgi:hypothetical protein
MSKAFSQCSKYVIALLLIGIVVLGTAVYAVASILKGFIVYPGATLQSVSKIDTLYYPCGSYGRTGQAAFECEWGISAELVFSTTAPIDNVISYYECCRHTAITIGPISVGINAGWCDECNTNVHPPSFVVSAGPVLEIYWEEH